MKALRTSLSSRLPDPLGAPAGHAWLRSALTHLPRMHVWFAWLFLAALILLIGARLAAPAFIRHQLIQRIDASPGYRGSIDSVHLHLWRGGYEIRGITIKRKDLPHLPPALTCRSIDISLSWCALLHGVVVAQVLLDQPSVHYAVSGAEHQLPSAAAPLGGTKAPVPWQQHLKTLFPVSIDEVRIERGTVSYQDPGHAIDLTLGQVFATIGNLTNDARLSRTHSPVATFAADGGLIGGGSLHVDGDSDILASSPTMHFRLAIRNVDLVAFNDALMKYEQVRVRHGWLDFFVEATVDHGHLSGYAKPLLSDCSVYDPKDLEERGFKAWKEAVVGAANKLLKNKSKDRLATDVPLKGDLEHPGTNDVDLFIGILKNGFIRALLPEFDRWRQGS